MVMLTYRTVEKLDLDEELGDLVNFFKRRGFSEEKFARCEIQGPYRKYGKTLGSYFWQGYVDPKSPFYQDKLR